MRVSYHTGTPFWKYPKASWKHHRKMRSTLNCWNWNRKWWMVWTFPYTGNISYQVWWDPRALKAPRVGWICKNDGWCHDENIPKPTWNTLDPFIFSDFLYNSRYFSPFSYVQDYYTFSRPLTLYILYHPWLSNSRNSKTWNTSCYYPCYRNSNCFYWHSITWAYSNCE